MSGPRSLRWRLGLAVGAMVTVLWGTAALFTAHVLRGEVDEVFDSALQETAQRVLPLAVSDILGRDATVGPQKLSPIREHEEYFTYVVRF